jgi:MDMPI C-terminal domain
LPLLIGKRAGAPEGSSVKLQIGDVYRAVIEVVDGRARVASTEPAAPTVTLTMPATTFAALVGGRTDAPHDVEISGDVALGDAVVAHLGFMP